jgi:hypothetical protein
MHFTVNNDFLLDYKKERDPTLLQKPFLEPKNNETKVDAELVCS